MGNWSYFTAFITGVWAQLINLALQESSWHGPWKTPLTNLETSDLFLHFFGEPVLDPPHPQPRSAVEGGS